MSADCNRTVVITGTNRGIGKATLERFASEPGVTIVAHARKETPEFLDMVSSLSSSTGANIMPVYFDLADEGAIKNNLGTVLRQIKKVDVLVNNAGMVSASSSFLMTRLEAFKETMQVNFFSMVLVTQLVCKAMIRNGSGAIVNMASIAALSGLEGQAEYSASKAAVIGLTNKLAFEFAPYHIRVNAVAPSLTETDMAKGMKDEMVQDIIDRHAMGRLGKKEEVADVIYWLASSASSYVNGECIKVTGGGYKLKC